MLIRLVIKFDEFSGINWFSYWYIYMFHIFSNSRFCRSSTTAKVRSNEHNKLQNIMTLSETSTAQVILTQFFTFWSLFWYKWFHTYKPHRIIELLTKLNFVWIICCRWGWTLRSHRSWSTRRLLCRSNWYLIQGSSMLLLFHHHLATHVESFVATSFVEWPITISFCASEVIPGTIS